MSGSRPGSPDDRGHRRARELAAARPDGFLEPAEIAWLDAHLATCSACSLVAAELDSQRDLFASGRMAMPEAPRDLWARTAAAIEVEARPKRAVRRRRSLAWVYAPLAGVMVVAIAVGAGLLNGLPTRESTSKGEEPDATPIALSASDVTVLTRGEDGSLEFRRQVVDEVCPVEAESCGLTPTPEITQTEEIGGTDTWSAIISPDSDRVVVMDRGGTKGVYVLPLHDQATMTATQTPTPEPTAEAATPAPSEAAPTVEPSATPDGSVAPTTDPNATASPVATSDPNASPSPPVEPSPSLEPSPSAEPGAIGSPAASPEPTPEGSAAPPSAEPSPTIEVTPRPDGAIEIASDVVLVGTTASYSPDGTRFAFTARPADGSAGPDAYVWRVGDARAVAVTTDHASVFSGWIGDELLVSRVVGGDARTVILGLDDTTQRAAHQGPMWRPTVGPGGRTGVWWDGTVKPSGDGRTWVPDAGSLVLEPWPAGDGARQLLAGDGLTDWQVQWDDAGKLLAVWTTTDTPGKPGTLSLFTVDRATGKADLANPKLDAVPAYEGFSLRPGRLTWSAPADGGDTTVQVLAWKGDTFGRLQILTEDGTTVVR